MRRGDLDALKDAINFGISDAPTYIKETVDQYIDEAPTIDTVPVVRCQECRCWKPSGGYAGDNINDLQRLGGCKWAVACVRENDFCSRGQRKEDEQDAD